MFCMAILGNVAYALGILLQVRRDLFSRAQIISCDRRSCLSLLCRNNASILFAVLLQNTNVDFMIDHMPWLLGSIGTLMFDTTIFVQFLYYGAEKEGSSWTHPSALLIPDREILAMAAAVHSLRHVSQFFELSV